MLASFMHDFEAERVRSKQREKEGPDAGKYNQVKGKTVTFDPRIPLSVRVMSLPLVERWVKQWNEAHPDAKPIERPTVIYEMTMPIPGDPTAPAE